MREYLEQQIAARRKRLSLLDQERSTVESELRAYEDALAQAGGNSVRDHSQCASLSRGWITILKSLVGFKHFNASEIVLAANRLFKEKALKKKQTAGSARAQLSLLTKKGIINRRGGGNYSFSDEAKLWLTLKNKSEDTTVTLKEETPSEALNQFGPELAARVQRTAGDAR
jgi:hypothetical protein